MWFGLWHAAFGCMRRARLLRDGVLFTLNSIAVYADSMPAIGLKRLKHLEKTR